MYASLSPSQFPIHKRYRNRRGYVLTWGERLYIRVLYHLVNVAREKGLHCLILTKPFFSHSPPPPYQNTRQRLLRLVGYQKCCPGFRFKFIRLMNIEIPKVSKNEHSVTVHIATILSI